MAADDPRPGAYRPFVAARAPAGRPVVRPGWRVLVHRKSLATWMSLPDLLGLETAQQVWDHLTTRPDGPPDVGSSVLLRGHHHVGKWPGYSRTVHFEISGAGRIDYQYNARADDGSMGDPHAVVKILHIDLGSH